LKSEQKPLNFLEFNINDEILPQNFLQQEIKENAQYIVWPEIKKQGKQKTFCEKKFMNLEEVFIFFIYCS